MYSFLVAIGLDPGNVDLYLEPFGCLSELGEHRKIVECLNSAIKILQGSSSSSGAAQTGKSIQRIVAITREVAQVSDLESFMAPSIACDSLHSLGCF